MAKTKNNDGFAQHSWTDTIFSKIYKNFSSISKPLTNLTRKDIGLKYWSSDCDQSFQKLKQYLTTVPILFAPDWSKLFAVHVSTSSLAHWATLTQNDNGGRKCVIVFPTGNCVLQNRTTLPTIKSFLALYMDHNDLYAICREPDILSWRTIKLLAICFTSRELVVAKSVGLRFWLTSIFPTYC